MNPKQNKTPKFPTKNKEKFEKRKSTRRASAKEKATDEDENSVDEDLDAYLDPSESNEEKSIENKSTESVADAKPAMQTEESGSNITDATGSPILLQALTKSASTSQKKDDHKGVIVCSPSKINLTASGVASVSGNTESSEQTSAPTDNRTTSSSDAVTRQVIFSSSDTSASNESIINVDTNKGSKNANPSNAVSVLTPLTRVEPGNTNTDTQTSYPESEGTTRRQHSCYCEAVGTVDRYQHIGMNLAEKFRIISSEQQKFIAEALIHWILAKALAGSLTVTTTIRDDQEEQKQKDKE